MSTPFLAARPTEEDNQPLHYDLSEVSDRLQAMRNQEETTYKSTNHNMNNYMNSADHQECRMMMCQWCYQVVDFCAFQRETVSIAFSILDRYLSTRQTLCDRRSYQLASMTSLYLAVKLNETIAMDIELLEKLSRYTYTKKQFEEMEMKMISALGWKLNRPTPLAFLRCFVAMMPASVDSTVRKEIMDCACYQVELAVAESSFVDRLSSEIAIAAIVNVIMEVPDHFVSEDIKANLILAVEKYSGLNINSTIQTQSGLHTLLNGGTVSSQMNATGSESHNSSKRSISCPESPVSVARRRVV